MSDREQRLRWIERLIGTNTLETSRASALVIPTASGSLAIEFKYIVEVVSTDHLKPLSLLPEQFCGVLNRSNALIPVIATGGAQNTTTHIVVVKSGECKVGLQFEGVPAVVDLDEVAHAPFTLMHTTALPQDILPILDIDAMIDILLALD